MPVVKYRDAAEMPNDVWYPKGSPQLLQAIREAWELAERTIRPRFPPGVYKHRCIEDAQRLRGEWDRRNFKAYRERLRRTLES